MMNESDRKKLNPDCDRHFLLSCSYVQVAPAPRWLVGSAAHGPHSGLIGVGLLLALLATLRASPTLQPNGKQSRANKRRK